MAKRNKKMDAELANSLFGDINRLELWLIENWKLAVIAAAAIVVAIGAVYGVRSWQASAERRAADTLAGAREEATLVKALAEYPASPAARYARIRLARLYTQGGRYEEAAAQFAQLAAADLPEEMRTRVRFDEAYLIELAGKPEEAAKRFAAFSRDVALSAGARAEAGYGAGRIYTQLKQFDAAVPCLTQAKSLVGSVDPVNVEWCTLAQFLLSGIESGVYGKYTPAAAPAAK